MNNARLAVNCDLIKYVEEAPDTVLTLVSGEKLVVRETTEQVIERVRQFRRSILAGNPEMLAAACPIESRRCLEPPNRPGPDTGVPIVDKSSFAGLIVGVGGIIAGLLLEGGKIPRSCSPRQP